MKLNIKDLKSFCEKNKNLLILVGILVLLLMIFFYLFFANNDENLSEGFEKQIENNTSTSIEENPYKIENPFVPQNNASTPPPPPPPLNESNQSLQNTPPPMSENKEPIPQASFNTDSPSTLLEKESNFKPVQEEAKEEQKIKEKPEDMASFLKEIQKDIELKEDSFIYDGRTYEKGDSFLDFYEIESIENNAIRFKDEDYSYALRFLGEDNE